MLRIYNDWLVDFCSHYPDRHIGLGCIPYGDIDAAVAEMHRAAKMGLKGIEVSCSWDMDPMWHPLWEPLWQAVKRSEPAVALPHLPDHGAAGTGDDLGPGAARGDVHRRVGVPDGADPHPRRDDGRGRVRALSEPARVVRRERHRLDPLRARPHGLRVRGPVPRPDEDEAVRVPGSASARRRSSTTSSGRS